MNECKKTVVLGNNITATATCDILRAKNIDAMLICNKEIYEDQIFFPYYYNDAIDGVMGKVLEKIKLDLQIEKEEIIDIINYDEISIVRYRDINRYKKELLNLFPKEIDSIEQYFITVESLGNEWMELIQDNFIFNPTKFKFYLKYYNLSYKDYLIKNFSDQRLIALLAIGMPNDKVALTVMAGYLHCQVFKKCRIVGGIKKVSEELEKELGNSNVLKVDLKTIEIEKNNNGWKINYNDKSIICKNIIEIGDNIYRKEEQEESLSFISIAIKVDYVNCEKLSQGLLNYVYPKECFWETLNNMRNKSEINFYPYHIWLINDKNNPVEKDKIIRIDIPIIVCEDLNYKTIVENVIMSIKNKFSLNIMENKIEIYLPKDHQYFSGYNNGNLQKWAFSPKETIKNPFNLKVDTDYYSTFRWGGAWFTAVLAAINCIELET